MRQPWNKGKIFLDPEYDEQIKEEKERIYMYVGDDFGIIKVWDMTYLLESAKDIEPCISHKEKRGKNYHPNRKENVNARAHYTRHLSIAKQ